jgi:hypothetical protein
MMLMEASALMNAPKKACPCARGKGKFDLFGSRLTMLVPSPALSPVNRFRNRYFYITASVFLALTVVVLCLEHPRRIDQRIVERKAAGKPVPTHWYVHAMGWRGLAVDAALAVLLMGLTPWAARRLKGAPLVNEPVPRRAAVTVIAVTGGLMLISGFANAPRLSQSLWGDEEYSMKRLIADVMEERGEDGKMHFVNHSWVTTLWSYRKTTNHIGYTVVARLFHEAIYRPGMGPTDPMFSELAARLPVFIAGLLSIAALAWAGFVWGWHRGMPLALVMYAAHPWFVRFGSDARGYGFVLLLVPLLIGILGRAWQTGRWRWWLAFGLAQFYLLWTYMGAVHLVAMLNLAAVGLIFYDRSRVQDRAAFLARLIVANVISAMFFIALMAPCLPQFKEFMDTKPLQGMIDLAWWKDALGYLMIGLPWHPWDEQNPLCSWLFHGGAGGARTLLVSGALLFRCALFALGAWALLSAKFPRWLLLPFIAGLVLMMSQSVLSGIRPYHWYLIPYLPGVILLWGAALHRFIPTSPGARSGAAWVAAAVLVFAGVQIAAGECRNLRRYPVEPCRESVALTRAVTNPMHPDYDKDVITAGFSFYTEGYDPGLVRFENADGLRKLMQRADADGKKLFVNFGFREWAIEHHADVMALLDDPRYFEHTASLPGMFFTSTREVYRYRGASPVR